MLWIGKLLQVQASQTDSADSEDPHARMDEMWSSEQFVKS